LARLKWSCARTEQELFSAAHLKVAVKPFSSANQPFEDSAQLQASFCNQKAPDGSPARTSYLHTTTRESHPPSSPRTANDR
jgi:hypothetical protein